MKNQTAPQTTAAPQPEALPGVLDVPAVAELLALSERTVRIRLREGTIPGWKIGNLWRVSRQALEDQLRTANSGKAKKPANSKK